MADPQMSNSTGPTPPGTPSFTTDRRGAILDTQENIRTAIIKLGVSISYNVFANQIIIAGLQGFGPVICDAALDRLWLLIDDTYRFKPDKQTFLVVVKDFARRNTFHPVGQYLGTLQWDKTPRISKWLTTYGGAEDNPYTNRVGEIVLLAAVCRIYQPGCKFDEMLVLENSTQGTNKSSAWEILAVKPEWFLDDLPLASDAQRVLEQTEGKWIVESAELVGMKDNKVEQLKAFLSRKFDRSRRAWGTFTEERPRQFIIVGSTNSTQWLYDPTGNRRFWPVGVERFDLKALERDRDQLWAEAVEKAAAGASIRLEPALWDAAAAEQEKRVQEHPMEDVLRTAIGGREGRITTESLWKILEFSTKERGNIRAQRISNSMRKLGWERPGKSGQFKVNGVNVSGYVKGDEPRKLHEVLTVKDGIVIWNDGSQSRRPGSV